MRLIILLLLVCSNLVFVDIPEHLKEATLIQALLKEHTQTELQTKLELAEKIAVTADSQSPDAIVFVLDGAEVQLFLRQQYRQQKELVDLASRLVAYGYVELKIGQDYIDSYALSRDDLPSFLKVTKNAAEEKVRLRRAGYISY